MKKYLILATTMGLLLSSISRFSYAGGAPGANTWYAFPPEVKSLDSVDFSMTVNIDPGYDSSVFWSNSFYPLGSPNAIYTGMQSTGGGPRGFIFSAWGATDSKPGDAGSSCIKFSENGEGRSCRIHMEWVPGHTYQYHVAGEGDNWLSVTITDINTNRAFKLGSVKIATNKISTGNMTSWTEYYEWSSNRSTCMGQPYSKVTMGLPRAMSNGVPAVAHITNTTTSKSCPDASLVTIEAADSIQENALGNSARGTVKNANGLCLDQSGTTGDGAKVGVSACTGKNNQAWVIAKNGTIQLRDSYCLTAENGITVKTCSANAINQKWKLNQGSIVSAASQLCLSVNGNSSDLVFKTCDNSLSEGWSMP